ncbi:hypothetical protein STTU_1027 [Streptomyces sp. Tu6071]|nr:hypothetical protein STTU_1027 [Streptomyces sp. Tu6071]
MFHGLLAGGSGAAASVAGGWGRDYGCGCHYGCVWGCGVGAGDRSGSLLAGVVVFGRTSAQEVAGTHHGGGKLAGTGSAGERGAEAVRWDGGEAVG